jgi:diaminopimelate decarboxylase
MNAKSLIEGWFSVAGGELLVGGVAVSEVARQYGTPLFVYDQRILARKWERLRAAIPPEFSICYSVKANPAQAILRYFLCRGAGLEIASAGEFHQAVAAGCSPASILFAGPGKTDCELELVLRAGIGEVHLESEREARRLSAIADRVGRRAPVALRINPGTEAEGGAMRMGGRPAPFGVDEEDVDRVLDVILSLPALDFRGIHVFSGTQILNPDTLEAQYRKSIALARTVAQQVGSPLGTLDFGGGLGVPYFPHESELDMDQVQARLAALMTEVRKDSLLAGTRFVIEPGRYLVAEAGIYITRVTDVKVSRGKTFAIVDGGMNHHLAASGNLGQTIKRNYPVAVLNRLSEPDAGAADVVGPLCTPLDILGRELSLPHPQPGDLVGVFQSGAYARSASPLHFLSHPAPPEVWVENGFTRLIRRRAGIGAELDDQTTPAALA